MADESIDWNEFDTFDWDQLTHPVFASLPVDSVVCIVCGSLVANMDHTQDAHRAWHKIMVTNVRLAMQKHREQPS